MIYETICRTCGKEFREPSITAAMNARRAHMERRHLAGEIETDT